MSLRIRFMNPPISGFDYGPIAETEYGDINDDVIFNVSLMQELGSISSFSFSTIATTVFTYYNGSGMDKPLRNVLTPGKTLIKVYENGNVIFYGRIFSMGRGVDGADTTRIICEDLRGYLRESFIFYSYDSDDDENAQYRALEGDSVQELLNAIIENHNNYMEMSYNLVNHGTYWSGNVSCRIETVSGVASGATLNNDLSLDGLSTLEALEQIFDDQGYEYTIADATAPFILIICSKKLNYGNRGTIETGKTLKSASKTENVQDMFSAVLPLGGFSYSGRRLSLTNSDFPVSMSQGYPTSTIDDLKPPSDPTKQNTDGERVVIYAVNSALYAKYGLRIKTSIYDDVVCNTDTDEDISYARQILVDLAKLEAEALNQDIVEWNVQAVDLHNVGIGPTYVLFGKYTIVDRINGITASNARLIKINKNYDNPANSSFGFEISTSV